MPCGRYLLTVEVPEYDGQRQTATRSARTGSKVTCRLILAIESRFQLTGGRAAVTVDEIAVITLFARVEIAITKRWNKLGSRP